MAEPDEFEPLRALARAGEHQAAPLPPEQIRRLGTRRRRIRHGAIAACALVLVVITGSTFAAGRGTSTLVPPPVVSTPTITAQPAPTLTTANLATQQDMAWHDPGDWWITQTASGEGSPPASVCLSVTLDDLGPQVVFRRDYSLLGSPGNDAAALAMEFDSVTRAEKAAATLASWAEQCAHTLSYRGYAEPVIGAWHTVATGGAPARFIEIVSSPLHQPSSDERLFQAYGIARSGNRLALISMSTHGLDNNWDYHENGPVGSLHPMFRTLPAVTARLAIPATTDQDSPTAPTRSLGEQNLVTPADIPAPADQEVEVVTEDVGRPADQLSVCQEAGLSGLDATQTMKRNFRYTAESTRPDPDDPLAGQPSIYTLALQFSDADAARQARTTVSGWLKNCISTLKAAEYHSPTSITTPTAIDVPGGFAALAELHYRYPREAEGTQAAYWESVGLLQVDDRLMIAVLVIYGSDHSVSIQTGGDPVNEIAEHELLPILRAGADRLNR